MPPRGAPQAHPDILNGAQLLLSYLPLHLVLLRKVLPKAGVLRRQLHGHGRTSFAAPTHLFLALLTLLIPRGLCATTLHTVRGGDVTRYFAVLSSTRVLLVPRHLPFWCHVRNGCGSIFCSLYIRLRGGGPPKCRVDGSVRVMGREAATANGRLYQTH